MLKRIRELTDKELCQLYKKLKKDPRIIELNKTRKVRELNLLERLMFNQIVAETKQEVLCS